MNKRLLKKTAKGRIRQFFSFLNTGNIRAEGWLQMAINTEANGATGHLDEFAPEIMRNPFVNNLTKADEGKIGYIIGELAGNWIDGLVRLACLTQDVALMEKTQNWIRQILDKQQKDKEPYIGVLENGRWENVCAELWPQSRAYLALLGYYEATHDRSVLKAVIKAADLTIKYFSPDQHPELTDPSRAGKVNTHALMIVEPMTLLYEITGKRKYAQFSEYIYGKLKYYNDYLLAGKLYLHGVHVVENVRVPALLYAMTGKREYLELAKKGVELIQANYINAAGAIRSDELVSYDEPNRASEYCAMTEWILTLTEMARITGDLGYIDRAEKCWYNAAMGARLPDGRGIQYLSYPNQMHTEEQVSYGPAHKPLCCNPNAARLFPYIISRMWMKVRGDLTAAFYGPCVLEAAVGKSGTPVEIISETRYPFEEEVKFAILPVKPVQFALNLRVPGWCGNPEIMINGEKQEIPALNGIVSIRRRWQCGDTIILRLPMQIKPDYRRDNLMAVNRGPLVFCLDIPANVKNSREAAPGFQFIDYDAVPDARWNYALWLDYHPKEDIETTADFSPDQVNIGRTFKEEFQKTPETALPWETPHLKIKVPARILDFWTLYDEKEAAKYNQNHFFKQPPVPISPIYRYQPKGVWDKELDTLTEITLVPYGTTRLRITYFPFFLWWI
ncbi:MAG: beta-L-arabinofuranosidase domain-containing protein [Bacillota bacterium]